MRKVLPDRPEEEGGVEGAVVNYHLKEQTGGRAEDGGVKDVKICVGDGQDWELVYNKDKSGWTV